MKVSYSPLYSALLTFRKFFQDENSIQLLHTFQWLYIYENTSAISAEDDRLKIHILVLQAKSFYSLITCIPIVPRNILTKFSGPSALNWMDGNQRFGDTVDKFQGYFSIPS